jgi:hypothetical protein
MQLMERLVIVSTDSFDAYVTVFTGACDSLECVSDASLIFAELRTVAFFGEVGR